MDPRLDQLLSTLNHHRVALGGLAVAITLGSMTGSYLRPAGLLEEPMAAQLIAGQTQAANAQPDLVLEPFPAYAANRPWVAGSDYARMAELPRLPASYDERSYEQIYAEVADAPMPLPDSTPAAADRAVDAVAIEAPADEPAV